MTLVCIRTLSVVADQELRIARPEASSHHALGARSPPPLRQGSFVILWATTRQNRLCHDEPWNWTEAKKRRKLWMIERSSAFGKCSVIFHAPRTWAQGVAIQIQSLPRSRRVRLLSMRRAKSVSRAGSEEPNPASGIIYSRVHDADGAACYLAILLFT